MKIPFYITLILLIGAVYYIFELRGEIDEKTAQIDSCSASLEPFLPVPGYDYVDYIPIDSARAHSTNFQNIANLLFDSISGGIISEEAMISMLFDGSFKADAFSYSICMDPTGTVINDKPKGLYVVFNPVKMEMGATPGEWRISSSSSKYYISRNWCPPHCMSFILPDGSPSGTRPEGE